MTHYIYTLEDTRFPGIVRYVGRTKTRNKRLNEHKRCRGTECHKIHWIKSVLSAGGDIKMVTIAECPADETVELEVFYIKHYTDSGADLTNSTEKSWGVVEHTPEAIARMAEIQSARSLEVNAKISATLTGRKMGEEQYLKHLDRVTSPEWKEMMSKVHKGKTLTQEQKDHLSKLRTGVKRGPYVGKKISEALKGKPKSAEHVAKSAAGHRGKKLGPQTPEQIAKRMAAKKVTMERRKLKAQLVNQPEEAQP